MCDYKKQMILLWFYYLSFTRLTFELVNQEMKCGNDKTSFTIL